VPEYPEDPARLNVLVQSIRDYRLLTFWQVRVPHADSTLFEAPKDIPDNMLVLMADIV